MPLFLHLFIFIQQIHSDTFIHHSFINIRWGPSPYLHSCRLSGWNLHGVPSRDLNSGLPYSKPARYQLSHTAPCNFARAINRQNYDPYQYGTPSLNISPTLISLSQRDYTTEKTTCFFKISRQIPTWIFSIFLLGEFLWVTAMLGHIVRKMDLILRFIERRLQMQFSIARKFLLAFRRYDVKPNEKNRRNVI
jgi:hypothetical protein